MSGKIQLPEDAFDSHLMDCATKASDAFVASVRPISGVRERDRLPEHVGTCILLNVEGHRILATAAHIADQLPRRGSLFVGGPLGASPVPLPTQIKTTTAPDGDRNADHYDLAFCEVPESALPPMGKVEFLSADRLSHNRVATEGHQYTALGYAISRNEDAFDHVARTITHRRSIYTAGVEPMPKLAKKLGVSGEDHLFQRYSKYSFDTAGQKMNSVNPEGFSGGALLDLGDFSSPTILSRTPGASARLSGMLIEYHRHHNAIVAVKIGRIFEAIRGALG